MKLAGDFGIIWVGFQTMSIHDKVKKVLEELPLSGLTVEIEPDNGFKVVAIVTSNEFETMDEGERQHLVWRKLIEKLNAREQALVEFEAVREGA
jgi:acid stress-induced BolA-like protein IbaG/YrbA